VTNRPAKITDETILDLWDWMDGFYGAAFTSQYGDKASEWKAELVVARYNELHIQHGINKCRRECETMPPNLSTFVKMCKPAPEEIGLPSIDHAFWFAVHSRWEHPVIWHVVQKIGAFAFRRMRDKRAHAVFAEVYQRYVDRVLAGERFSIPVKPSLRLPPPEPMSPEQVQAARKALLKIVNLNRD